MLKFKNKTPLVALTCLIAASFSLGSLVTDGTNNLDFSNDNVAWVGKKPIKNFDFLRYKQFLSEKEPFITNEDVIKKIGERSAILQYATNEMNIVVLDDEIVNEIKKDKKFQTNNNFDEKIYLSHLKSLNIPAKTYEENVRENLKLQKLMTLTDIRNRSAKSAKLLSDSLFQVLDVDIYEMNYTYQENINIEKEEVAEHYNSNRSSYVTSETYNTSVFKYYKSDEYIDKKIKEYKSNPENIYDIRQILVNTKDDIDKIQKELSTNTFENLARKYSIDNSSSLEGGLISGIKENELTPDFLAGLKDTKLGHIFVARSTLGYHLIKKESVINENISKSDFKKYFKDMLDNSFNSDIESGSLSYTTKENIEIDKNTLKNIFSKTDLIIGDSILVGEGDIIEKMEITSKNVSRFLDINSLEDYKEIELIYKNIKKLGNAIKISSDIEKTFNENTFNWIMKSELEINKNSQLPQELLDVIYTTKVGDKGDLIIGNKYFVFIIKGQKSFKTKEADFNQLINSIYNFESGHLLIEEARSIYPIKIEKKLVSKK